MGHIERALRSLETGNLSGAETLAREALENPARRPDALHVLSLVAHQRSANSEALSLLAEAVELDPRNAKRLLNLTTLAYDLCENQRCVQYAGRLLACQPDCTEALNYLGRAHNRLGQHSEAAAAHERAIAHAPSEPKYWSDLGAARLAADLPAAAVDAYRQVVRLAPEAAIAHFNLGTALLTANEVTEAVDEFTRATQRDHTHVRAHLNLGIALKRLGHVEQARNAQRSALAIAPSDPDVQWNLALTEILLGDYAAGFAHFEARLKLPKHPLSGRITWDGRPLPDKNLVIVGEQGLGDTIQFLRFVEAAATRCRGVTLLCRDELVALLRGGYRGSAKIDSLSADPGAAEVVSLMSLPHVLTVGDRLSMDSPYLGAKPEHIAAWRRRLPTTDKLSVGLSWQGNPRYRADSDRSMPLCTLTPLLNVADCHFVSLQRGFGSEQLQDSAFGLIEDLGSAADEPKEAFVGTAALVGALDLVVTTDTAVAHVAGATGAEVWMLLAKIPDFRWGLDGNRWYPSMRIFRQRVAGDWGPVVEDVRAALVKRRMRVAA